jgi:hypothetical protein
MFADFSNNMRHDIEGRGVGLGGYTVKKVIVFPVPSRDVSSQTLPGREKFNNSRPDRVKLVTSRLGTGKTIIFFYSVHKMMSSYVSFGFSLTRILKASRKSLKVYISKALYPSRKTKEKEGYFLLNICSYLSLPLLLSTVDQRVCTM